MPALSTKLGAGDSLAPVQHTTEKIAGRYRPIATIQLCLVWWLYRESHITRRQLRVYFALHEMAERRRYTKAEEGGRKRQPFYTPAELAGLVGGRGSQTAEALLRADVRKLVKVGLITANAHAVVFARSPDQINVRDLSGFWDFWQQIPNRRRSVPVPRRTLRALAAGFSKAVTGVLIAMMIRSIHWHKREGDYRVDGRTKGSWISQVFDLSRRAVTDARGHLIAIGWIEPQETSQVLLNRFGNHDRINVDWTHKEPQKAANDVGESASPVAEKTRESASPIKNRNTLSYRKNIKNNKPETAAVPDPHLVGNRKERVGGRRSAPKLRLIDPRYLGETQSLLELYQQAIVAGLAENSDRGRLEFFAYAERARSRGQKPAALFSWLLKNRRSEFITQADEDAAARRLKEHFYPELSREPTENLANAEPDETQRFVWFCMRFAAKHHLPDGYSVAKRAKGWTREEWEKALFCQRGVESYVDEDAEPHTIR